MEQQQHGLPSHQSPFTLRIRRFPKTLSTEAIKLLLTHHGAIHVRTFAKNKKVLATFKSQEALRHAQDVLSRMEFDNKHLIVAPMVLENSSSTSNNNAAGASSVLSPYLSYAYPPASESTVSNIANALLTFPSFYTQVCHLMNKLNLPVPFSEKNTNDDTDFEDLPPLPSSSSSTIPRKEKPKKISIKLKTNIHK